MGKRQSLGAASVDAGGVYVFLLGLCEPGRIEIIGALRDGAKEIEVIEFLAIPKSIAVLCAAIEKEFGPLIFQDDQEIEFMYYDARVSLTLATRETWQTMLQSLREAA